MEKQFALNFVLIALYTLIIFPQKTNAQKWLNKVQSVSEKVQVTWRVVEDSEKKVLALKGGNGQTGQANQGSNNSPKNSRQSSNPQMTTTSSTNPQLNVATVTSFDPQIQILLDSCKGDRNNQIVTIYFRVKHQKPHQQMSIGVEDGRTQAFDSEGMARKAQAASIAGRRETYAAGGRIPTNTAIPCTMEFANVVDFKNPSLQTVFMYCEAADANGGSNLVYGEIEINNLTIDWK